MRIASLRTASVDQRTTQSDEKHNIHFKQKTAALTLSTLYFSIKFSCSMLLYVVCSCIALYRCHSLPAQPCGWCAIRTLRVGRHHPRRLDLSLSLSLSLDTPSRTLQLQLPLPPHLHPLPLLLRTTSLLSRFLCPVPLLSTDLVRPES